MKLTGSLHTLDFIVIGIYIIALLLINFFIKSNKNESDDLFLAGRSLTWPKIGLSIFGTDIQPSSLIAGCSIGYTTGIVAGNFDWLAWIFLLLLGMLFIPHYINTKISTMPEFLKRRFGNNCYVFLSWFNLLSIVIIFLGGTFFAGGILLKQILGWPLWASVLVLATFATTFTAIGGLAAVVRTEAFQSVFIIISSATLTIIAFLKVGPIDKIIHGVPTNFWHLFRPADNEIYPWPAVLLGYPVMGIWYWCTDQTIVQRVLAAKNTKQGQLGTFLAASLKILMPFIFVFPGILCAILFPHLANSDHAYLTMVTKLLPAGLVGMIISALFSSLIGVSASGLNSFSTVFTLDVYTAKIRKTADIKELKLVGRLSTIIAAIIAIIFAFLMEGLGRNLFDTLQSMVAFFAPPISTVFLLGVLWKRATPIAAILTLTIGSALCLAVGLMQLNNYPNPHYWPHYMLLSFYLFVFLLIFMIVISLLTKPSDEYVLPTLIETYQLQKHSHSKIVWLLWSILACLMIGLYIVFN